MEREAFDAWAAEHYDELVAVARRRGGSPDDVQAALLRILETQSYVRVKGGRPWTWAVNAIRSVIANRKRGEARARVTARSVTYLRTAGVSLSGRKPRAE